MTTAAPAPSTTVPACSEGDSFSIASATLPDAEGCYINTQYTFNDQIIYTASGNADLGQIMMYAVQLTGADASSTAGSVSGIKDVLPQIGGGRFGRAAQGIHGAEGKSH